MSYGDRRDYQKIDLYVRRSGVFEYVGSTTWSKTCREAKEKYRAKYPNLLLSDIKARFAK